MVEDGGIGELGVAQNGGLGLCHRGCALHQRIGAKAEA